ncbi:branched-chain amino acid ABC transporter substrate-binding protein [Bosea sp. (in: a-proteobacteria)]|uniref:branched-chain amino acid ABC transporter substrate-binding protein n=1 Tax=Bosea sp. (in: a-proteobacteria) TaxID=1871050 RepID=UPI002625FD31|nr:branched-chain amino acid ABC transporter substrate-binding protein [Bosea sp. (in: a-proteobacteria)]MCO5090888.1 branched-chain amino acid ABC transporter substrate-binding protein [Bosea sp. (in: a-proteobacteria)]
MQKFAIVAFAGLTALAVQAAGATEPVRLAFVDPLSGPLASSGQLGLNHYRFAADEINAKGGVLGGRKLEIVPFDSKASPQEAILILKRLADEGFHFVSQGNSSAVAAAIVDAVDKNNARDPAKTMVYLNYSAVDPALTNDKCSYWHFRFDSEVDMKTAAMTEFMARNAALKKVYLINQDYSFGRAVGEASRKMLGQKRADIEIVGDEYHPLVKIKDFAPYIAKIKASGAQAVMTGNFGADLTLLVKAAKDAGLEVDWYTYYSSLLGAVTAIGDAGVDRVYELTEWHENIDNPELSAFADAYKAQLKDDWRYMRVRTMLNMFAQALDKAGSDDPRKVAAALDNATYKSPLGDVVMQAENHQLLQPQYVTVLARGGKHDLEGTGIGRKTVAAFTAGQTELPTTCKMKRPD